MGEQQVSLSRWWWPVTWLRIVYGVWVDQLWYWQNVRPRLSSCRESWGIVVQGVLGASLVVGILVVLTVLLHVLGVGIDLGSSTTYLLAALAFGGVLILAAGVLYGPPGALTVGVTAAPVAALAVGAASLLTERTAQLVLAAAISGTAVGVNRGVKQGLRGFWTTDRVWDLIVATLIGLSSGALTGVATGVSLVLTSHLGVLWATRQVGDAETRKRLADPGRGQSQQRQ